jgi:4-diphosphocytidyl-2-C-methyl-D-erythritol kinase
MIFFPNCKINLGLRILRKRTDGYHDLETLFYPLPIKDVLEVLRSDENSFTSTGIPIPGDPDSNLCFKAYDLLKKDYPHLPPVKVFLHKHIPIGAGLGGGSADGAGMLQLLNKSFHLGIEMGKMMDYAARLGSDCPLFILNRPCLGEGRGERLTPVELNLSAYSFVIVHPGVHISTAWAFSQCAPQEGGKPLAEIIRQPIDTWAAELHNDFEKPILRQYPELQAITAELYKQGALYAALTGSGSSFFGIFEKGTIPSLRFGANYQLLLLT